ncbi:MAG: hypothetical protein J1F35_06025 [Erysipelotrichales bacterium]|nr:hypothetical protein [Erysipelotrichales bacterium]
MKSLVQFIEHSSNSLSLNECIKRSMSINEGGHSVKDAGPIPGDIAGKVGKDILKDIKNKFAYDGILLGSTGKKGKDQMSGDIDVAIQAPWEDYEKIKKYVESLDKFTDFGNINKQLHVINFGYEWETDKVVQIDIMFVEDLDFADFVYHSPDFTKNESKYKGMYASALFMAVASCIPVNNINKEKDGEWEEYFFSQAEGLKIVTKTNIGKNTKLKNPKKVSSKTISKNINDIVKTILGNKATKEDCYSFEKLTEYLSSNNFKYKDKLPDILEKFSNDWQIKMKTSSELMEELKKYLEEKFNL